MRAILLLFLSASSAFTQNLLYRDISGPWKVIAGDRPEYSSPDFNDAGWDELSLPAPDSRTTHLSRSRLAGIVWLRRELGLRDDTDLSSLALTLGAISQCYEVYVNGVLVGSTGDMTFSGAQIARPRTFLLPPQSNRRMIIAVRVVQLGPVIGIQAGWLIPDTGPYLLTSQENIPRNAANAAIDRRRKERSPRMAVAAAGFVLSFVICFAWLSARHRWELLWLSGLLLCSSFELVHQFALTTLEAHPWRDLVTPTLLDAALPLPLLAEVILAIMKVRSRWVRVVHWALGAAILWLPINALIPAELWVFGLILWPWPRDYNDRFSMRDSVLSRLACAGILYQFSIARGATLLLTRTGARFVSSFQTADVTWPRYPASLVLLSLVIAMILLRQLVRDRQEKERLAGEFEAARVVQQLLFPHADSASDSFAIEAVYLPATEVGGDFHWRRANPDGSLLVAVGDVSGKGLKAAMLVSVAVGVLETVESSSPATVLETLNRVLCNQAPGGFVTCCCALFQMNGPVILASAGHPAPYLEGREAEIACGLPLGIVAGETYVETTLNTASATFISDGIPEATNGRGELFGFARMQDLSQRPAQAIADAARVWGQNDDITVVTVRRAEHRQAAA